MGYLHHINPLASHLPLPLPPLLECRETHLSLKRNKKVLRITNKMEGAHCEERVI